MNKETLPPIDVTEAELEKIMQPGKPLFEKLMPNPHNSPQHSSTIMADLSQALKVLRSAGADLTQPSRYRIATVDLPSAILCLTSQGHACAYRYNGRDGYDLDLSFEDFVALFGIVEMTKV